VSARAYRTIAIATSGYVVTVTLDRPDVRNAFNEVVIDELTRVFTGLAPETRAVILTGAGPYFCAGADVQWMRKSRDYTEAENLRDAHAMAAMLRAVEECPRPVIAKVRGAALGGGAGLVSCCDIVAAAEGTTFGFTEVRLGIVPANISTFVLPKIGARAARRYFLTGERFDAAEARRIGLVHEVVPGDALDATVDGLVAALLECGPEAVATAKEIIRKVSGAPRDQAFDYTARTIARVRVSAEGQEGLGAFIEKRKPRWTS
jgi:methylglutaconyl-CoA hydratase